jgi:hypothetical protein
MNLDAAISYLHKEWKSLNEVITSLERLQRGNAATAAKGGPADVRPAPRLPRRKGEPGRK